MCKCNMDIQSGMCIQIAAEKDRLSVFWLYAGKRKAGQTLVPVDFTLRHVTSGVSSGSTLVRASSWNQEPTCPALRVSNWAIAGLPYYLRFECTSPIVLC